MFDAISREKFLGIYNKSKKFESLASLNEFIKKKSRSGVFMLCSTLLSLAVPLYEDPFVNDQQSFLDKISEKIDGASISFAFKKFLKSILMCSDSQQLPTFAELKTEYLKAGGTMFSHEDLSMTTQSRSDLKAFNFRAIGDFLEKLISSTHSRLDFRCEQDFFDQQVQQNEILKKSTLNIQILDFDKNDFNSNWNSLANSLSANLISNFAAQNNENDRRIDTNQKENEKPYVAESSGQKKDKVGEQNSSYRSDAAERNRRPSKSQFAHYKSFEHNDDHDSKTPDVNTKFPNAPMKPDNKAPSLHSKDLADNVKSLNQPSILNNTSLTEMIKKFACTNSYSESGKDTANNLADFDGSRKNPTVSLQNMINDLKANNANQKGNDKDKSTPGMENQLNGLINLLQSNQVPPNVLKMICDELFFKQKSEGNVFYLPGSHSNVTNSHAEINKLNKTHDSSKLELVDLENQTEATKYSCNRRLTFQTDTKNPGQTSSPNTRGESDTTPRKLRPSPSGESSTSKTFDNGKFVSFAPMAKQEGQPGSQKDTPVYANKYSHSRSNSQDLVVDEEVSKSGKLQRRPSFVKNHLKIETEEIKDNSAHKQATDTGKENEKLLEFENQILTHIQLSPKISVYKTMSMNEWNNIDQKTQLPTLKTAELENKLTTFNNLNGVSTTESQPQKNVRSYKELVSNSPNKNDPQLSANRNAEFQAQNYSSYPYSIQTRLNSHTKSTEYPHIHKSPGADFIGEKVQVSHLVSNSNPQQLDFSANNGGTQPSDFSMVQPPRSPVSRRVVIETPGVRSVINENYAPLTDEIAKGSTVRNTSPIRITKVIRRSYTITPDKRIIEHEIPKDNVIEEIIFNDSGSHEVNTDLSSYVRKSVKGADQGGKYSYSNGSRLEIPTVTKTTYIRESPAKYIGTSQINMKHSIEKGPERIEVGPSDNLGQTSYVNAHYLQSPVNRSPLKLETVDGSSRYLGNENRSKSPTFVPIAQPENHRPLSNISKYLANEFRGQKHASNTTSARETQNSNKVNAERGNLERFYNGEKISPVYPVSNQLHSPRNADYFNTLLSTFENLSSVQPLNRSTSRLANNQMNSTLRQSKANPHQSVYLNAYSSRQVNRPSPQRSSYIHDYQTQDYRQSPNTRNRSQIRNSVIYPKDGHRSPNPEFRDSYQFFATQVGGVYTTDPHSPIRSHDRTSQFSSLKTSLNMPSRHY